MKKIKLEDLQQDTDMYFDMAYNGENIQVETEKGVIVLLSEKHYNNIKNIGE